MKLPARRGASFALALAVLLGGKPSADGRQFSGHYRVTNANPVGDEVAISLILRIHNHGDRDVTTAVVVVRDSVHSDDAYRAVNPLTIAAGGSARLVSEVVVRAAEFEYWQRGGAPNVYLEIEEADGGATAHRLRMSSLVFEEEE